MPKRIKLTQGKYALVDDEDYEWLSQWKWCLRSSGYAIRNSSVPTGKRIQISMHREIVGTPEGMDTDHINGDKLDNRRSNLRICTHAQNGANRGPQKNGSSGYKGVSYHCKKWRVQICINGKTKRLGGFNSLLDAAKAYDKAARKYHGEFARTNVS